MSSAAANSRGTRAWPVRFAGGSVASVAARAAFVDGTIADAGAWSSPPTGRVEGRTTTRGGVVLGPWAYDRTTRLCSGMSASASARTLSKRCSRSTAIARCTISQKAGGNDGRRSASGVGLPT